MKETSNFSFYKDKFFLAASLISALSILLIIIGIIVSLFIQSFDAIKAFGFFNFIFSTSWDYNCKVFSKKGAKIKSPHIPYIILGIAAKSSIAVLIKPFKNDGHISTINTAIPIPIGAAIIIAINDVNIEPNKALPLF